MRELVERHKQTVASFIEQRREQLLVVHASDADAVFVLQLASELDEASSEDLFVILGDEFRDADSYALALAETFARQHALASAAMTAASKPPLPELPPLLLAPDRPGHERLRELVAFAHELLPEEARRLVVVIAPTLIQDRTAFLALVGALLPRPGRERWMTRLRLVVRDVALTDALTDAGIVLDAPAATATQAVNRAPLEPEHPLAPKTSAGVAVTHIDFGRDAIREQLAKVAADEATPLSARMQSLLAAAILDGVYGEHEEALSELERVLAHYQSEKNVLMQAVTVNAMGEVCQLGGGLDQARHWFECALALAVESESALALTTVAKNLGNLCFVQGDYASATQYFDGVVQLTPKLLDNETKSWALEQRGASEALLGEHAKAIETWRQGADFCRNTDHTAGLRAHLTRLSEAYGQAGLLQEKRLAERELGELGELGAEASHA